MVNDNEFSVVICDDDAHEIYVGNLHHPKSWFYTNIYEKLNGRFWRLSELEPDRIVNYTQGVATSLGSRRLTDLLNYRIVFVRPSLWQSVTVFTVATFHCVVASYTYSSM